MNVNADADEKTPTDSPLALSKVDKKLDDILSCCRHMASEQVKQGVTLDRLALRVDGVEKRQSRLELERQWLPGIASGAALVIAVLTFLLVIVRT